MAREIVTTVARRLRDRRHCAPPDQESGQTLVEYSLILGVVAAVVVFALTPIGAGVQSLIAPVLEGF